MSASADQPIPYDLTEAGWSAARAAEAFTSTLTAAEAAAALRCEPNYVRRLARLGVLEAIKVDDVWLIDGASVARYRRQVARHRRTEASRRRYLPAEPLLKQIQLGGGLYTLGVEPGSAEERAFLRARRSGRLTLWAADHLAVKLLGLTVWDLWPQEGE